jgi:hypothetical protein
MERGALAAEFLLHEQFLLGTTDIHCCMGITRISLCCTVFLNEFSKATFIHDHMRDVVRGMGEVPLVQSTKGARRPKSYLASSVAFLVPTTERYGTPSTKPTLRYLPLQPRGKTRAL